MQIAEDLQQKLNTLKALATTYNLLDSGLQPHSRAEAVEQSLNFIRALHSQVMADAVKHPDAANVPELKALLEKEEVKNV